MKDKYQDALILLSDLLSNSDKEKEIEMLKKEIEELERKEEM